MLRVTATAAPPPPKLSDLSKAEITEALDLGNKSGDSKMAKALYNELQERRRPI
jgi:hypothetical protein